MNEAKNQTQQPATTTQVQWAQASKKGGFGIKPDVGQVIEGYLVGFKETTGKFGTNKNPVIRTSDGREITIAEMGNLKNQYFVNDLESQDGGVGSYVRLEREPDYLHKKTGKMTARFDVKVATNIPRTTELLGSSGATNVEKKEF